MTENLKNLIYSILYNDTKRVYAYTRMLLNNDKTGKDSNFVYNSLKQLDKLEQKDLFRDIPANIQGALQYIDLEETFVKERYYFRPEEVQIKNRVQTLHKVSQELNKIKINIKNTLLLYGESGTGKTTLGQYIALELGLPFYYVNFNYVIDSYLGKTQLNIQRIFDYIKTLDCVVMFDEIDAIALQRGTESVSEMSRVVIALMQCIDSLTNNTILIGATNREDMLDLALKRRFVNKSEVKRPKDIKERIEYAKKFLDSTGYEYSIQTVEKFCEKDMTQSTIIDGLTMMLANKLAQEIDKQQTFENGGQ